MSHQSNKAEGFMVNLTTVFNVANTLKVVGIALVSFIVVWLNSTYVSVEKFNKLEERVAAVENRNIIADKQLAVYVSQYKDLTDELKKINDRLSGVITPNGNVIYNDKFITMSSDIESVKKDVSWIKDELYNRKK